MIRAEKLLQKKNVLNSASQQLDVVTGHGWDPLLEHGQINAG